MKNSKQLSMRDKKADILAEYQRLKKILEDIHGLTATYLQPNGNLKSILKKPQPPEDIENSTSMHAINISGEKELLGRLKRMSSKSIGLNKIPVLDKSSGRPSQNGAIAKDKQRKSDQQCMLPVIRVNVDANITKRRQKVKQGRVEQPLRRTSRRVAQPDRFSERYRKMLEPNNKCFQKH